MAISRNQVLDSLRALIMGLDGSNTSTQSATQQIVTDTIQNPPKQFTYAIANGQIQTIFYDHSFVRILSLDVSTGVQLRFGQSGTPTDVVGAGVGYELDEVVRSLQVINNSGGVVNITVSLSMGKIYDDRLNVSGAVTISNSITSPLFVRDVPRTFNRNNATAVPAAASVYITGSAFAGQAGMWIQNVGNYACYLDNGGFYPQIVNNGLRLEAGEKMYFANSSFLFAGGDGTNATEVRCLNDIW